ncbi:MAG: glycogen synthase [Anaerolineaceae bacterium]|jgi:starch synthase
MINTRKSINVAFASAEAVPFVKVGGLGDVAGTLPAAVRDLDPKHLDIRVFLPFHQVIKDKNLNVTSIGEFTLPSLHGQIPCRLWLTEDKGLRIYLIDNDTISENSAVYTGDAFQDGAKYAVFSLAVLEAIRFLDWQIDIFHANDWHTALCLYAIKTNYLEEKLFSGVKNILSVHNLPYNGYGAQPMMTELMITPSQDEDLPDWARFTPLPLGVQAADQIIAVSKGYASEILTPQFGSGLNEYLMKHQDKVTGIINGIDTVTWNPETDELIPERFSLADLTARSINKAEWQSEKGFSVNPDIPLLTVVSRLDAQKGLNLLIDSIVLALDLPWQLSVLGTGNLQIEERMYGLAEQYPDRIAFDNTYSDKIAHNLYACGDIFLMPSLYEPCGLSQMFAMRYGNIPLATAIGGLQDTITDLSEDPENATGFLIRRISEKGFLSKFHQALSTFPDKPVWNRLQRNAMQKNFSWQASASEYLKAYKQLLDLN